jgi:hypothetical protein
MTTIIPTTIYAIENKPNRVLIPVNGVLYFAKRSDAREARATLDGNHYRIVSTTIADWKTAK